MTDLLIEQLQYNAIDTKLRVSDLLRTALLVASKLGVPDAPAWIEKELSGYPRDDIDALPAYRFITGRVIALNPVRGWQTVMFDNQTAAETLSRRPVVNSIAQIEALADSNATLHSRYSAEAEIYLRKSIKLQTDVACEVNRASFVGILNEVRNRVLVWSMELEMAGIRGDGMSFSREEKEKAHTITINTASGNVNVGVIGPVGSHASIVAGSNAHAAGVSLDEVRVLVAEIERHAPALTLAAEDRRELDTKFAELTSNKSGETVEPQKLRRLLGSVTRLVGKAGETVITIGINAFVEAWMRAHGLAP